MRPRHFSVGCSGSLHRCLVDRQLKYRQLMEQIRRSHESFALAWKEAKTAALNSLPGNESSRSWEQIWQANGIAYKAARSLSDRRDRFLRELFENHLGPLYQDFILGHSDAVDAIIDFLEVDVPAFRCGYVKEAYLRKLKAIPLTNEQRERLRQYGIRLCNCPQHRREIGQAGRLMILIANQRFMDQLRVLTMNNNQFIARKATKMFGVIQNGRKDFG